MPHVLIHVKQALRSLQRTPTFAVVVVLILALGIGLHSAMLAVFDRLVVRPLPLKDLDRLVAIYDADSKMGWTRNQVSPGNFMDYQRRSTQFEAMAIHQGGKTVLAGDWDTVRIPMARVSASFFHVLQIPPLLGRTFTEEEDRPEGPKAVLLSHGFWSGRLGRDPGAIGRTLNLDGIPHEIVGILPQWASLDALVEAQVFIPIAFPSDAASNHGDHSFNALGRLKPGASLATAKQDLKKIASALAKEYPETNQHGSANVTSLVATATEGTEVLASALVAVSTFLLLIACANVSNLMMARGIQRQHDLAIRAALGAARRSLVLGMLVESSLLGVFGAFGGLFVGLGFLRFVQHSFPEIPQLRSIALDSGVLLYALATISMAILFSSLVPLWRLSHVQPAEVIKDGQKGSGGLRQRRFQAALLVVQVALSMLLLMGSGLMLRSLWNVRQVPLGFNPDPLLTAHISLPKGKYAETSSRLAFLARLQERLSALPGVAGASAGTPLPPRWSTGNWNYRVAGQAVLPGSQGITWRSHVTPDFFATLGLPLREGAIPADPAPQGCLVNETFAKRHGISGRAVGRQVVAEGGEDRPFHILGVVKDIRNQGLEEAFLPQIYFLLTPSAPSSPLSFNVFLKCVGDPKQQMASLRASLRTLEPGAAVTSIQTMGAAIQQTLQVLKAATGLFLLFGSLGLLLAAVGLYGLIDYWVAQRTRETAIRIALGAEPRRVVGAILRQGLTLTLVGLGLGATGGWMLGRVMASELYRVSPTDPAATALSALTLLLVSSLAALLPALRAVRVDPLPALRYD